MNKLDKVVEFLKENGFEKEAFVIKDIVVRVEELFTEGYAYSGSQKYFALQESNVNFLCEEYKEEVLVMTGYELSERFIDRLEDAGFNPWMFNEGRATKEDSFNLTKRQSLALGMNEYEFNARKQK
jgi:hypothetical protein